MGVSSFSKYIDHHSWSRNRLRRPLLIESFLAIKSLDILGVSILSIAQKWYLLQAHLNLTLKIWKPSSDCMTSLNFPSIHVIRWSNAGISHHYVHDIDILHQCELVSFFCVIKISPNFKEQLFQGKSFSGYYRI